MTSPTLRKESDRAFSDHAILKVDNVVKKFGDRCVLNGVNFALYPGQVLAISGPSGCGKSTLLNIIGMLEQPTSGAVYLFGGKAPRLSSRKGRRLLREKIGYLFQNCALVPDYSVDQNLKVAQSTKGSRSYRKSVRKKALTSVGLDGVSERKTYTLSGGEQQRVAIARLLLKPCELVLADEPTGSLDPKNRDATLEYLSFLREDGKAILVVTHDPHVVRWADAVLRLGIDNSPVRTPPQ